MARYRGLVRACVQRYRDSPESPDELMQVGYLGLLKAINNFDTAVGENLAAYAQPCVSGEIKRYFREKRWQVRVRRPVQELRLEMRKASAEALWSTCASGSRSPGPRGRAGGVAPAAAI